jgi:hypothetical protein
MHLWCKYSHSTYNIIVGTFGVFGTKKRSGFYLAADFFFSGAQTTALLLTGVIAREASRSDMYGSRHEWQVLPP